MPVIVSFRCPKNPLNAPFFSLKTEEKQKAGQQKRALVSGYVFVSAEGSLGGLREPNGNSIQQEITFHRESSSSALFSTAGQRGKMDPGPEGTRDIPESRMRKR